MITYVQKKKIEKTRIPQKSRTRETTSSSSPNDYNLQIFFEKGNDDTKTNNKEVTQNQDRKHEWKIFTHLIK